jgi:hypothetical protein
MQRNPAKPKVTRRRFLQAAAAAGLCAGLGVSLKAALDLLTPPRGGMSVAEANRINSGRENLERVPLLAAIRQAYAERQFSPPEMNEFLRTRRLITFSAETLQRIKRQQRLIDGAERTLVAALGDSVLASMRLEFLRPEIKRDPTRVKLGALEGRLGGVLNKYTILSQQDRLMGVVLASTPYDLYTNDAMCTEGCEPKETLLQAVIRHKPAVAFVCTGRVHYLLLEDYIDQIDHICRELLRNAILPVLINAPLILQIDGLPYPKSARWYDDPDFLESTIIPTMLNNQRDYLAKAMWMSFYADAMLIPNICSYRLLARLPHFGMARYGTDHHLSLHQPPDDESMVLHDFDQPIPQWSGSEVMNYLVLSFLKHFDEQRIEAPSQ